MHDDYEETEQEDDDEEEKMWTKYVSLLRMGYNKPCWSEKPTDHNMAACYGQGPPAMNIGNDYLKNSFLSCQ